MSTCKPTWQFLKYGTYYDVTCKSKNISSTTPAARSNKLLMLKVGHVIQQSRYCSVVCTALYLMFVAFRIEGNKISPLKIHRPEHSSLSVNCDETFQLESAMLFFGNAIAMLFHGQLLWSGYQGTA